MPHKYPDQKMNLHSLASRRFLIKYYIILFSSVLCNSLIHKNRLILITLIETYNLCRAQTRRIPNQENAVIAIVFTINFREVVKLQSCFVSLA